MRPNKQHDQLVNGYRIPLILDIRDGLPEVMALFADLDAAEKTFDEMVRDVIARLMIDGETTEGIADLLSYATTRGNYSHSEGDLIRLASIIPKLAKIILREFQLHRVYDDTGYLNYQFQHWVAPGIMLLQPVVDYKFSARTKERYFVG